MNVEHLMTSDVVTVPPETPLKRVAAILADRGISGVPVRDSSGAVVGVVSEADILRLEQGLGSGRGSVLDWLVLGGDEAAGRLAARTAGEAMTSPAITIDAGRPVSEAARLMVGRGVNRLPVLHGRELVGIVTRADLVHAFRRSDDQIEREIREDVLLHTLWIAPARLGVAVEDGEVTLRGRLETVRRPSSPPPTSAVSPASSPSTTSSAGRSTTSRAGPASTTRRVSSEARGRVGRYGRCQLKTVSAGSGASSSSSSHADRARSTAGSSPLR